MQRLEVARPTGWQRLPYKMAAAAAAAVMVATAALGGWWLGHETGDNPAPELAGVATDDLVFTLAPLNVDGRASGRIFMSDDRTRGMVVVVGLPQLIPGRVYGVWLVTNDQQRVSAGRFVVDERGASLTSLTLPPINYDEWSGSFAGLAVTEVDPAEPTRPAGPDLLAGPLY